MRPRKRRVAIYVTVGVVVVVVALVLVAVVPLWTSSGSKPSNGPLTFSAARSRADQSISGYQGQSWSLLFASGFGIPQPITVNELNVVFPPPFPRLQLACFPTETNLPNVTVPALSGFASSGALPLWYFLFMNSSSVVIVGVLEGQASIWFSLSGQQCASSLANLSAVPNQVVDTPSMVSALAPYDGPFLARFPNVAETFSLYWSGGLQISPGTWSVDFIDCSSNRTGFGAFVNATTGRPWTSMTVPGDWGPYCASAPPSYYVETSLGLGVSYEIGSNSSDTDFGLNVTSTNNSITWSNLSAVFQTTLTPVSGAPFNWTPVTSGWVITALNRTNATIATYDPSTWSWSGAASQTVVPGDSLRLEILTSLLTYPDSLSTFPLLLLGGRGQFDGSVQWPLFLG